MSREATPDNPAYKDREFIESVERNAPAKTREIADELGCGYTTASDRLKQLYRLGDVGAKTDGPESTWIWMEADDE